MSLASNFFSTETAKARAELETWVNQISKYCEASKIHWCDGSQEERDAYRRADHEPELAVDHVVTS